MPALAADEATLSEVLEVLGEPIKENDLWAILTGSCLSIKDGLVSGPLLDRVTFLSPNTIILCREGVIRFSIKSYVQQDVRFVPPESYSNVSDKGSKLVAEKMLVYSLGMIIYVAADYGSRERNLRVSVSSDLEDLLIGMCEDNPGKRLDITHVLRVCSLYCDVNASANRISALVKIIFGNFIPANVGTSKETASLPFRRLMETEGFSEQKKLSALERLSPLSPMKSHRQGPKTSLTWVPVKVKRHHANPIPSDTRSSGTMGHSMVDFEALLELEKRKLMEKGLLTEKEVQDAYANMYASSISLNDGLLSGNHMPGSSFQKRHIRNLSGGSDPIGQKLPVRRSLSGSSFGETTSIATSQYSSSLSLTHGTYNLDSAPNRWPADSWSWHGSSDLQSEILDDRASNASAKQEGITRPKEHSGPEFLLVTSDAERAVIDITPARLGPLPKGQRLITVILPNLQRLETRIAMTSKVKELFDLIAQHLSLRETMYFGLAQMRDSEHHFLELDSKLLKHSPPGWKDEKKRIDFILSFRVKIFIENVRGLRHFATRHLFYVQLRSDILSGYTYCDDEKAVHLAGLALQSEYGDYNGQIHGKNYFTVEHYLPGRIINKLSRNEIFKLLPDAHRSFAGLSQEQAELEFLAETQTLPEYGVLFYKVSRSKKSFTDNVLLGICVKGIIVYELKGYMKLPLHKQPWSLTKEFSFRKNKFCIEPNKTSEAPKMIFYTNHYKKSKYLLRLSQSFHRFHQFNNLKMQAYPIKLDAAVTKVVSNGKAEKITAPKDSRSESSTQDTYQDDLFQPLKRGPPEKFPYQGPAKSTGTEGLIIVPQQASREIYSDDEFSQTPELRRRLSSLSGVPERKIISVTLTKRRDEGLGITIVGGEDTKRLGQGIFIKHVASNGLIANDGRLQKGDRILAVNGKSLENVTHDEAVESLKNLSGQVEIIVSQISGGESFLDSTGASPLPPCLDADVYEEPDVLEVKTLKSRGVMLAERDTPKLINAKNHKSKISRMASLDETDYIPANIEEDPYSTVIDKVVASTNPALSTMQGMDEDPYVSISDMPKLKRNVSADSLLEKSQKDAVEKQHPRIKVELLKRDGSLGISIVGGRDSSVLQGHILVSELHPGGPAELSANIKPGDRIVEVNGISLNDVFHRQAVEILKKAPEKAILLIERANGEEEVRTYLTQERRQDENAASSVDSVATGDERYREPFTIYLEKQNGGLGLNIVGGEGSFRAFGGKMFIRRMFPGQPAAESGKLKIGDIIWQVNGKDLIGLDKQDVVQILRDAPSPVELLVQRLDPAEIPMELLASGETTCSSPEQILAKVQSKIQGIHDSDTSLDQGEEHSADIEALYATVSKKRKVLETSTGAEKKESPRPVARLLSVKANYTAPSHNPEIAYEIKLEASPPDFCAEQNNAAHATISSFQEDITYERESSDVIFQSPSDLEDGEDEEDGDHSVQDKEDGPVGVHPEINVHLNSSIDTQPEPRVHSTEGKRETEMRSKNEIFAGTNTASDILLHRDDVGKPIVSARSYQNEKSLQRTKVKDASQSSEDSFVSVEQPLKLPEVKKDNDTPGREFENNRKSKTHVSELQIVDDVSLQLPVPNVPPLKLPVVSNGLGTSVEFVDQCKEREDSFQNQIEPLGRDNEHSEASTKYRLIKVELERGENGLGFTVAGGYSTIGGCFVRDIVGDPALTIGTIRTGDQLLEVNGTDVSNFEHMDAISLLRNCGKHASLVFRRKRHRGNTSLHASGKDTTVVTLTRNSRGRFGLLLEEDSEYIVVGDVVPNEPAARDGNLRHGDRVLEINDEPTAGLTIQEARDFLQSSGPQVTLVVEKVKREVHSRYAVADSPKMRTSRSLDTILTSQSSAEERVTHGYSRAMSTYASPKKNDWRRTKSEHSSSSESELSFTNQSMIGSPVLKRLDYGFRTGSPELSWLNQPVGQMAKLICVQLIKGPTGLGLSLGAKEFPDGNGVIIRAIDPEGVAAGTGQLKRGDRIMRVNGRNVENMSQHDVVSFLRNIPEVVSMEVYRIPRERTPKLQRSSANSMQSTDSSASAPSPLLPRIPAGSTCITSEINGTVNETLSLEFSQNSDREYDTQLRLSKNGLGGLKDGSADRTGDILQSADGPSSSVGKDRDNGDVAVNPMVSSTMADHRPMEYTAPNGKPVTNLTLDSKGRIDRTEEADRGSLSEFVLQEDGIVLADHVELANMNLANPPRPYDELSSELNSNYSDVPADAEIATAVGEIPIILKDDMTSEDIDIDIDIELSYKQVPVPEGPIRQLETSFSQTAQRDLPLREARSSVISRIPTLKQSKAAETENTISNGSHVPAEDRIDSSDTDRSVDDRSVDDALQTIDFDLMIQALKSKITSKQVDSEFQELKKVKSWGTVRVGKRGYNKTKNRAKAPLPYDENRVRLTGGEETDYINASFLRVETEGYQYNLIATQGPLNNTVEDFWKMVCENRVELVVMVTNDFENGKSKCHRYWPDIPGLPMKVSGRWSIDIVSMKQHNSVLKRELIVRNLKTGKTSRIWHFWFKDYPESGGLKSVREFVEFTADAADIANAGPAVVHCSTSGERTGVFIVSYILCQSLYTGAVPDILQIAKKIVKQRSGLMQSKESYACCYKVAIDLLQMLKERTYRR